MNNPIKERRQLYWVWKSMRARCLSTNSKDYKDYGGRGIKICSTWNTFSVFEADMGARLQGCLIKTKEGKWIPEDRYREVP